MSTAESRAKAVDHLAVAVPDLEEGIRLFSALLGIEPVWIRTVEEQRVRVAMFRMGDTGLELIEGTDPDSTVSKFVARRGAGLHHVCFVVDDLQDALERTRADGFQIVGQGGEIGVEGRPVAFLHPRSTGGVLAEFIEGVEGEGPPHQE